MSEFVVRADELDLVEESYSSRRKVVRRLQIISENSVEALDNIKADISRRETLVLNALVDLCNSQDDATDNEITQYLFENNLIPRQDPNFVRPRRFSLEREKKLIFCSRKRFCTVTHQLVDAWKVAGK